MSNHWLLRRGTCRFTVAISDPSREPIIQKTKKKFLPLVVVAVAVSGCAGSYYDVESQTPAQLKTADPDMICLVASRSHSAAVIGELVRRGLIRSQFERNVAAGQLSIGMTTEEMQCTYFPLVVAASNVSSVGEIIVWNDGSGLNVVTTNGIVTEISQ